MTHEFTKGAGYQVTTKRQARAPQAGRYLVRYVGPDPARDGWLLFASMEQDGLPVRLEASIIADAEPMGGES